MLGENFNQINSFMSVPKISEKLKLA